MIRTDKKPSARRRRSPAALASAPSKSAPTLVLLPTLNEEAGLRATLQELHAVHDFPAGEVPDVLVVDGHSTDATVAVAAEFDCRLLLQHGRGKGAAVREGLDWAIANGFGSVAVLDADGTYPCDQLPTLIRLLEHDADVVAGVRHPTHPSGATARNLVHRVGNGMLNLGAAVLSGGPILDVCTGFWGVRTSVVPSLRLESDGFEVESELFVKTTRHHLRFAQMPVEYRPRIGEAKLHAVRDGAKILLSIVHHAGSPGVPHSPAGAELPAAWPGPRGPLSSFAWALPAGISSFPASSILIVGGSSRPAAPGPTGGPSLPAFPRGMVVISLAPPAHGRAGLQGDFVAPSPNSPAYRIDEGEPWANDPEWVPRPSEPRDPRPWRRLPLRLFRAALDSSRLPTLLGMVTPKTSTAGTGREDDPAPEDRAASDESVRAGSFPSTPVAPRGTGTP